MPYNDAELMNDMRERATTDGHVAAALSAQPVQEDQSFTSIDKRDA